MKKIHFKEAIIILIIMLIILGTAVIKFGLSPQIPVLFTIALLIFWARFRGGILGGYPPGNPRGDWHGHHPDFHLYSDWGLDCRLD